MQAPISPYLKLKALFQLGLPSLIPYAWYQIKLRTGLLIRQTAIPADQSAPSYPLQALFDPPRKDVFAEFLGEEADKLLQEADEILAGGVHLFGGDLKKLDLSPNEHNQHWTNYISQLPDGSDIKPIWELGRFAWATTLARAYQLSGDEKYATTFWRYTDQFIAANPPNQGPHWSSAQEVALRLTALAYSFSIFVLSPKSTASRLERLSASLAAHAQRIPPTLAYARAQNNNHLLSEAMGLYTAAALLPDHPKSTQWRKLGRKTFLDGLKDQIAEDGSYSQHSANYHRLMLQLGLWAYLLAEQLNEPLPASALDQLATATQWLLSLLDEESGQLPNLGPNDGAYILPLTTIPYSDYRPLLQAAGRTFLGRRPLPAGPWDEMALWLSPLQAPKARPIAKRRHPLRLQSGPSWAYLRTAHFVGRPGHADQLHLDLWWRGLNLAKDAGSYRYNAPDPWDNALSSSRVHNTVTVNSKDQMTAAGRFLWLDWAQAKVTQREGNAQGHIIDVSAEHNGYRKLGIRHKRRVKVSPENNWIVEDSLASVRQSKKPIQARLHWLLPDWDWDIFDGEFILDSPKGPVILTVNSPETDVQYSVIHAGKVLTGSAEPDPIMGWASHSYGLKVPALSFIIDCHVPPPLTMQTTWTLPDIA